MRSKVEEMDVVFLMDRFGYAKPSTLRLSSETKESALAEKPVYMFRCEEHGQDPVCSDKGQMHTIKVMDLRRKDWNQGTPIDNFGNYSSAAEQMIYVDALEKYKRTISFCSSQGRYGKTGGRRRI